MRRSSSASCIAFCRTCSTEAWTRFATAGALIRLGITSSAFSRRKSAKYSILCRRQPDQLYLRTFFEMSNSFVLLSRSDAKFRPSRAAFEANRHARSAGTFFFNLIASTWRSVQLLKMVTKPAFQAPFLSEDFCLVRSQPVLIRGSTLEGLCKARFLLSNKHMIVFHIYCRSNLKLKWPRQFMSSLVPHFNREGVVDDYRSNPPSSLFSG